MGCGRGCASYNAAGHLALVPPARHQVIRVRDLFTNAPATLFDPGDATGHMSLAGIVSV